MPRPKESDDESEIKSGRRSRAVTGMNIVDSPLRRSTRNRQQINRDLSPDGVNTSGPVTRTTRRKAASQEVSTAETTRTLRSRKTSFTSDTSESHDIEIVDFKRTTRKSTTAAVASDTPTNVRLRRSVRAGSESKTLQSPAKTNRLTRASSLDLEERDNDVQSNLQTAHNSTPIKLRRRASILPSEPALIEEIEKDNSLQESLQSIIEDDQKEKEINDTENKNNTIDDFVKHMNSTKSPVLRLSRGFTPEVEIDTDQSNDNANDISTNPLKSSSIKSILEETNDSPIDEESSNFKKSKNQIHEITQTPKVIVEKMKFPFDDHKYESLDISLNNKENEKSNVTIPTKKLKFSSSEEALTQRKSLTTPASEKISIVKRLNKTIDDEILTINENLSNESLPLSKKALNTFSDIKIIKENVFSVNVGSDNESIIITEEIKQSDSQVKSSENTEREQSLKDISLNSNLDDDVQIYEENDLQKSLPEDNEISMMVVDEEDTNNSKQEPETTNKTSNVTSPSLESKKADEEYPLSPLTIEEVNSTSDECGNDELKKKSMMKNNFEDKLPINEIVLSSEEVEKSNKEFNKSTEDESDYDLNQLFKDIPADEWSEEPILSSENDNEVEKSSNTKTKNQTNKTDNQKEEKNMEKESVDDFELVLVDKKAWEAAEADRLRKIQNVVLDTIQTDTLKKSIDPPASPSYEEIMDIEENEIVAEVKNKSNNAFPEQSNNDKQSFIETNNYVEKEDERKDTSISDKFDSLEKEVEINRITPIKIDSITSSKNLLSKNNSLRGRKSLDSFLLENKISEKTSLKTRKSLNILIKLDNNTVDTNERDEIKQSIKPFENSTNKLSNVTESEHPHEVNVDENKKKNKKLTTNDSENINKSFDQSLNKKTEFKLQNTPHKETIVENFMSQTNSDLNMQSTDSENESDDQTISLPAFLRDESSNSSNQQENDSSNIDSDIAREYNLNGDNISEYSDDNISGDICHASETESTDSDEEDDMADFIVDDEEIDEESESESVSDNEKRIHEYMNESEDVETENDDERSDNFEGGENKMSSINKDESKYNKEKEEKYQHLNESTHSGFTILQENNVCENEDQVPQMIKAKINKLNTSESVKDSKKNKLKSLEKSKINLDNSFNVNVLPAAKLSSFNKSMLPPCTNSPETRLLLKEKLNDSLPALKLEPSNKKRKSSVFFVEENDDNDKLVKIGVNEESINDISKEKISKKIQKITKCKQHDFIIEDMSTENHESLQPSKISHKNIEKKKKKALKENSALNSNASLEKTCKKVEEKQKLVETKKNEKKFILSEEIDQTSTEKMKKKKNNNKNNLVSKKMRRLSSETYYTAEEVDTDCFENLQNCQKSNKSKNNIVKFTNSEMEKSSNSQSKSIAKNKVKRLPDDVIEGLFDIPLQPKKKRKLLVDQKVLPSRKMFDSEHPKPDNISIEDEGYIPLSSSGGTTSFYVMNIEKPKKSKKLAAVYSFRERMLRKNQRQPVSAYLMYQQKLKALKNHKY